MNRHWREKRQCLSPAFFFVLEKAVKSAGNAVIPTFPAHCPHGLQHLRYKRPMFAFTSESGYTLGFRRRIAHKGSHAETGGISDGALSLSSTRTARSRTSPGRVSERQTLPFWGLGRGCSRRTQKAFGTAMRSCASLSRGVAAPQSFPGYIKSGVVLREIFQSPRGENIIFSRALSFCLNTPINPWLTSG